jgi:hypothetical protein
MAKKLSMEFDFHEVDTKKLAEECDSRIKEFNKLLDQLPLAHVKKRMLWNQIFENALVDRRNAYIRRSWQSRSTRFTRTEFNKIS